MVKNLPANVGDMGSGLGRSPMPQQLSLYAATTEPVL